MTHRSEIVWSDGFGHADLETGQPVTSLTRFRIGAGTHGVLNLWDDSWWIRAP